MLFQHAPCFFFVFLIFFFKVFQFCFLKMVLTQLAVAASVQNPIYIFACAILSQY